LKPIKRRETLSASRRQFVHARLRAHGFDELGQVLVVGEVDDLPDTAHVGDQAQSLAEANSADANDVHGIA
jgi:hypothetical protein